jgi:protein RecA
MRIGGKLIKTTSNKQNDESENEIIASTSNTDNQSDDSIKTLNEDFTGELIKQINKDAGDKIAFNLGSGDAPTVVKRWISTGSRGLNYIIANARNGGLPEGRIVEILGNPGCHAKGTKILMFDGTLKNVENIVVGDKLMGIDSAPRTVLSLTRGAEEMYEIQPIRGDAFVVNKEHQLSLMRAKSSVRQDKKSKNKIGKAITISVKDYMQQSDSFKKHHRLYKCAGIDFGDTLKKELIISPYILGLLLGDGCLRHECVEFTTSDQILATTITEYANTINLKAKPHHKENNLACGYRIVGDKRGGTIKNNMVQLLKTLGLLDKKSGDKFVPQEYKVSSQKERLELIAGLLDTDGSYNMKSSTYDFITKSEILANDLAYMCRSVGLYCSINTCVKRCQNNYEGLYYRVYIGGNVSTIPCKLARKIAHTDVIKHTNSLLTSFNIKACGVDKYYGFTLDGDHLYMLDSFIVNHNCGKSHVAYEICKSTQQMGGIVVYIDTENATSLDNLKLVGIDVTKKFVFIQTNCTEEVFKAAESAIMKARSLAANIPVTIIWDSVAASSPKAEIDGEYDANTIGLQARVVGKGLRKIANIIADQKVLFVIINQIRMKIGVVYGSPETSPGGMAIPYACSVRVKMSPGQQIKKMINGKEEVIGIDITAKTIKNKVNRPFREVDFAIHFGKGVVDHEHIFDYIREYCSKNTIEVIDPKTHKEIVISLTGVNAWKTFSITDKKTGEFIIEEKFYKSDFKNILNNEAYKFYIDTMFDAAYIMRPEETEHPTIGSMDTNTESTSSIAE